MARVSSSTTVTVTAAVLPANWAPAADNEIVLVRAGELGVLSSTAVTVTVCAVVVVKLRLVLSMVVADPVVSETVTVEEGVKLGATVNVPVPVGSLTLMLVELSTSLGAESVMVLVSVNSVIR